MKPEVSKIFDDLDDWLNHCRMELVEFNPKHLYKSPEYKEWKKNQRKDSKRNKKEHNG